MIDITGVDLIALTKAAYALSQPLGLGMLHFREGELSDADAEAVVARCEHDQRLALTIDYLHGRSVKLTVFRRDGRLEIHDSWYDHSPAQLTDLLARVGVSRAEHKAS